MSSNGLWVFGYGSLVWKPGFEYEERVLGHIEDHSRVFWQGNVTHRGTPGKPGRVATLVKKPEAITYGVAFRVVGSAAMAYLNQREAVLGGYNVDTVPFYPAQDQGPLLDEDLPMMSRRLPAGHSPPSPPKGAIHVLLWVATEQSEHWLGESSEEEIAEQVVNSSGPSGHNVEYVLRLAEWMKAKLPDIEDPHLYKLETLIRGKVSARKLNIRLLMGEDPDEDHQTANEDRASTGSGDVQGQAPAEAAHPKGGFAACVGHKCLRCVKI